MLIYDTTELDNRLIRQEAEDAASAGIIASETVKAIVAAHPCTLYSPHLFVRIGLIIATMLCATLLAGLFALLMLDAIAHTAGPFLVFWGCLAYGALELWMASRKHYRSGVDDGLMWMSAIFLASGLAIILEPEHSFTIYFLLLTAIATWFAIRTAEPLITLCAWVCGILFVLCAALDLIADARFVLPFLGMGISAVAYFLFTRMQPVFRFRHYDGSLSVLRIASLLTFYMSCNYYIVHHAGMELLGLEGAPPLPWLFWTLSIALPPLYIWMGLRRRDRIPLATGLILIAAAVFTVRAYHAVMPIETAMVLGGIVLVAVSYFAHRYLKSPKLGFTTEAMHTEKFGIEQLEGLIIAETMQQTSPSGEDFRFGGGSGGGGGASGEY